MQNKNLQIWDQICLIWIFLGWNVKSIWHIWNQHCWICQNAKFHGKETQSQKYLTYAFLGWNLEKLVIFQVSPLKFCAKIKMLKFWTKMPEFGILGWSFKNYCHIWSQHHQISQMTKCQAKMKETLEVWEQKCPISVLLGYNLVSYCQI